MILVENHKFFQPCVFNTHIVKRQNTQKLHPGRRNIGRQWQMFDDICDRQTDTSCQLAVHLHTASHGKEFCFWNPQTFSFGGFWERA